MVEVAQFMARIDETNALRRYVARSVQQFCAAIAAARRQALTVCVAVYRGTKDPGRKQPDHTETPVGFVTLRQGWTGGPRVLDGRTVLQVQHLWCDPADPVAAARLAGAIWGNIAHQWFSHKYLVNDAAGNWKPDIHRKHPAWQSADVRALIASMFVFRDNHPEGEIAERIEWDRLPILADALQEADFPDAITLNAFRSRPAVGRDVFRLHFPAARSKAEEAGEETTEEASSAGG